MRYRRALELNITIEEAILNRKKDFQCSIYPEDLPETYVCACCQFLTPWFYGAADQHADVCDSCYGLITKKENEKSTKTV